MTAEDKLQMTCIRWFRNQYPDLTKMLIHVANQRKTISKFEGRKLSAMSVTAGVSDLLLLIPKHGYGCLCIELKVRKGDIYNIAGVNHIVKTNGTQSQLQHEWELSAISNGNKYVICRTFDEFKREVEQYLN